MITFEQALEILNANLILLGTERVDLQNSLNRVLRETIVADLDMPPFNKAAMDGYACRREDIKNELEVIETIPAGYLPQKKIESSKCAKIMTGAMMPEGADCVIIVEEVEEIAKNRIRFNGEKTANNFARKGEDVVNGQSLIEEGTRITAQQIAPLALAGYHQPIVSKQPKIGIITTGNEIVEPAIHPQPTQIRNTNSYQLTAQCTQFGCLPKYYGIVSDTNEAIGRTVARAKAENDLILITGGVSMGDYDLVPSILEANGFKLLFQKIAIQPGKPTVFGRSGDTFVFGLPGNPVSAFIVFETLVKEFLAGLMGLKSFKKILRFMLARDITRKSSSRLARIPVKINSEGMVESVEYHGSAHITSLADCDGIVSLPIGVNELKKGTVVDVRQF